MRILTLALLMLVGGSTVCTTKETCLPADGDCAVGALLLYTPTLYPRFLYSGNLSANTITGYRINYSAGSVDSFGSVPQASNAHLSIHPNGKLLYAANGAANTVTTFVIDPFSGALNLSSSLNVNGPAAFTPAPAGAFGYLINTAAQTLETYILDPTGGALFFASTVSANGASNHIGWHPDGRTLYIANSSGNISTFTTDGATGQAILVASVPLAVARYVAVDPLGRFLYCTDNTSALKIFTINADRSLTQLASAATGSFNTVVTTSANGNLVYVTNQGTSDVSIFRVDSTGTLTPVATRPAGSSPIGVVADVTGKFVFVGNSGSLDVYGYRSNPATGDMTQFVTLPAGLGAQGLVIANQALMRAP